ncbi:hypothetical protein OESDEN_25388 [Oesophagostomum dentatum]|uniref:Uncharacterized protein n=1 Tax=Oesophagostomum dentatum TaxID=61180 RepID=A0A0B1RVA5_OESDE|nr:hypothetical protein OESDEN_25388 [Oesophagostomum dentatum]
MEAREKYRKELEAVQAAKLAGETIDSPWAFKGKNSLDEQEIPEQSEKAQLNGHYENDGFDDEDDYDPRSDLGVPRSSSERKI